MIVIAALIMMAATAPTARADLSVASYCDLTLAEMQQQLEDIQDLIDLVGLYGNDAAALSEQEEIKRAEFDQEKEARYASFGTTAKDFVLYMGKNKIAVDAYLAENPSIQAQIDTLSGQLNTLITEHQTIKDSLVQDEEAPVDDPPVE